MRSHESVIATKRGDLARRAGCNLETIRYYEKIGLLAEPARTVGGHRIYDGRAERRLRFILRARDLGFSIEEIRELLRPVDGAQFTCAEIRALTVAHLAKVRAKIADLRRLERVLARTVAACSGDAVPECPVIDSLAGKSGTGSLTQD